MIRENPTLRQQQELNWAALQSFRTLAGRVLEELQKTSGSVPRKLTTESAAACTEPRLSLNESAFRFMMNEDQMATEKLSEGIRLFARDLRSLRDMVSVRLESAEIKSL